MKLPRIQCLVCSRTIAVTPIDAIGVGAVVDHKRESRSLVLCEGSMLRVPLPGRSAWQQELGAESRVAESAAVQTPLFD